jgi:hypothetical protein
MALDTIERWIDVLELALLAMLGLVLVTGAWWTSRAYRNLVPMQVRGLRIPMRLAPWLWLVPVANLWFSKLLVDDLWRASDPAVGYRSRSWRKRSAPLASNVGWVGVLGAALLVPLSWLTMPDNVVDHQGKYYAALLMAAAGYLLVVLGLGVLAVLVEQITDRQQARVDRIGTAPSATAARADGRVGRANGDGGAAAANDRNENLGRVLERHAPGEPVWGAY